jgi:hypothetical protein
MFWYMTPDSWQIGVNILEEAASSSLKMEAAGFSETLITLHHTVWHHIPEG